MSVTRTDMGSCVHACNNKNCSTKGALLGKEALTAVSGPFSNSFPGDRRFVTLHGGLDNVRTFGANCFPFSLEAKRLRGDLNRFQLSLHFIDLGSAYGPPHLAEYKISRV